MAKALDFQTLLKKYYGNRCVVKGAFTYETGLYFYAFDATKEEKACKKIFEMLYSPRRISPAEWWREVFEYLQREEKPDPENIVLFGVTAHGDDDEEEKEEEGELIRKKGILGLVTKLGVSSPGPLVYDRTTGNTFFFPDGTPYTLAKSTETSLPKGQMPLQKLKIRIVGKWKS
jgi:hypothetical protein